MLTNFATTVQKFYQKI